MLGEEFETRAVVLDALNPDPAFKVYPNPDPIRIQGFDDQKLKFFSSFFDQKLQFTYVKATGEAFSPQNRTSSTLKNELYLLFYVRGSFLPSWIQIRIANPDLDTDPETPLNPDPKHCLKRRRVVVYLEARAFIHTCGFPCIKYTIYIFTGSWR